MDGASMHRLDKRAMMETKQVFKQLGLTAADTSSGDLVVRSPIDGAEIASVRSDDSASLEEKIARARRAFEEWREVPAPRRGELVRLLGEELRRAKEPLGALVSIESGKILQEGMGEVQEMIDICDFAVGLSRQLYGLTMASERPGHKMMETWHPLGPIGVISAFNFPVAVWSWNFALAMVCGDPVLWKPSEKDTGDGAWPASASSSGPSTPLAARPMVFPRSSSAAARSARHWWPTPACR